MNNYISLDSITLGKYLKKYRFTLRGNQKTIKVNQKRFSIWNVCIGLSEKIEYKGLDINKKKHL